ncbi:hypothetical protein StoSoilB13_26650 (plasmid) [Arthrobacter sp. StoSoilB13]|nr:hypothetical protein StoSoilB13_26650 [Arthrobacter sp. StoSoilB13]
MISERQMKRLLKTRTTTVLLGAILLGGAGIGVASATSQPTVTPEVSPQSPAVVLSDAPFEKNAAGQTYGLPTEVEGVSVEPDLIRGPMQPTIELGTSRTANEK